MKIELKNVKVAAFASEETTCFRATVYVDGKKAGEAHNDGKGGCTWIEPPALQRQLDDYAKTLPEYAASEFACGEFVVTDALDDYLTRKDLARAMNGRILFAMPDGTFRETTKLPPATMKNMLESPDNLERCAPGGIVLNNLPADEALRLYKTHGSKAP